MRWLLLAMLAGCGSITTTAPLVEATPVDAAADVVDGAREAIEKEAAAARPDADARGGDAAAADAPICTAASSPPYCSSCRDARGVCMCGALPCCDQHCQS